jgi:hypothetical protein
MARPKGIVRDYSMFAGRYVLQAAVVGQVGLVELNDGSMYIIHIANWSKLIPHEVRGPQKGMAYEGS